MQEAILYIYIQMGIDMDSPQLIYTYGVNLVFNM